MAACIGITARPAENSIPRNTSGTAGISSADLMIVAGTSLTVYPAAGLVRYFRGSHLVLINRDATPMDSEAELVLHEKVGEVLGSLT